MTVGDLPFISEAVKRERSCTRFFASLHTCPHMHTHLYEIPSSHSLTLYFH